MVPRLSRNSSRFTSNHSRPPFPLRFLKIQNIVDQTGAGFRQNGIKSAYRRCSSVSAVQEQVRHTDASPAGFDLGSISQELALAILAISAFEAIQIPFNRLG